MFFSIPNKESNSRGSNPIIKEVEIMKRLAVVIALAVMGFFCLSGVGFSQAIENEFYLITPVSKDVHDPAL